MIKEKVRDIIWPIKRTWRQVKRVWDFIPIIWDGADFDYRYAIDLFQYQLRRTANYLDSDNSWGEGASDRAKRIRMVNRLLDKVYSGEYSMEYQDKVKEKYGDDILNMNFELQENGNYLVVWEYDKRDNKDEIKEYLQTELLKGMDKENRAHKLVWELIEHNIRNWWD